MTTDYFKTIQPSAGSIFLLYTDLGGGQYDIIGVNVSRSTCGIVNVRQALNSVKKVTLTIGGSYHIVDVTGIKIYPQHHGLTIDPIRVNSITNTGCTLTFLTPSQNEVDFQNSDYDVLIGNATKTRTAEGGVFDVDRNRSQIEPQNLESILSGKATPAEVQEYNYSSVGFINARYNGTKTTEIDYGGLSPLMSLRLFEGSVYDDKISDGYICSQSFSERKIVELGYNSVGRLITSEEFGPSIDIGVNKNTFDGLIQGITASPAQLQPNTTQIILDYGKFLPPIAPKTLVEMSTKSPDKTEIVEILSSEYVSATPGYSDLNRYNVTLKRGIDKPSSNMSANSTFADVFMHYVSTDYVMQFEGSTAKELSNRKIWVRETGQIFTTDYRGRIVITNTLCDF